jgi:pimeloyl-ACP methyl ester carboxylesterase
MDQDRFVDAHDGIRLAVRDHGRAGEGRDLLLLHGAGTHLLSLTNLVRKLSEDDTVGGPLRIVTMDARWSGQSGDSPTYEWSDLVADVDAVIDQLGLEAPVVGGHSWGGMIAVWHAAERPGVASAAINIDGQGSGDPTLYDGLDEVAVQRAQAMLEAVNANPFEGAVLEGDATWLAEAREAVRTATEMAGVPTARVDEFTDRHFLELSPGRWRRHPSPTMMEGLRGDLRLFDLYRRVACPLLLFNCTAPNPPGLVPPELDALMAAYRRGLRRALGELAAEQPNVTVVELADQAHNDVLTGGARATAAAIRTFLASHTS